MNGRRRDEAVPADVLEILRERAARVRATHNDGREEGEATWVAEVPVGAERFAFPLASLRGCVPFRNVTPVPLASPGVLGIFRHEGRIVPVYQLSRVLGAAWSGDPEVLVLVDADGELIAFEAEAVPTPRSVSSAQLLAARAAATGPIAAIQVEDGAPLRLVDPADLPRQGGRH